jgi:tripartite ATP-independent transporter DctM subunit
MGLLAYPAMLKAGYDTKLSSGVICAGGTLGILIPPSIMLIVYGASAGVSVVKLYAAAMLPGFLLASLYVAYVIARAVMNPRLAPKLPENEPNVPFVEVTKRLLTSFFPLAVLIMSVLGAILFGLATPSEAAAVGALGALVLAAAYRALTWDRLKEAVFLTARTTAMVCYLFVGSWTFSSIFSYLGGHHVVEQLVLGLDLNTVGFLILSQFIIFLLGWPLEWTEIIIIFVPIFLPLLAHFDVDPIFFGVLVALNLQTSFLTPPMAMSAYYLKGIAPPHVQLMEIFRGCMPFLLLVLVSMVMVYNFSGLVEWLPRYLYGG